MASLIQGTHASGKTGKTGEITKKTSLQGNIREFENSSKIREISGNFALRCENLDKNLKKPVKNGAQKPVKNLMQIVL